MKKILTKYHLFGVVSMTLVLLVTAALLSTKHDSYINIAKAATCPNTTPTGSASLNFSVGSTNVNNAHTVWSRIKVPTANSSYYLKLDALCYKVGGVNLPVNKWIWVKYQDGNSNSIITTKFTTAGNHSAMFIGDTAEVKVDRVLMLTSNCDPNQSSDGLGGNCTAETVVTTAAPTATTTSTATIKPTVAATATPSIPIGGTTQPPATPKLTVPGNLRTGFIFSNAMTITWDNSTGGQGLIGYKVYVNNVLQGTTIVNSYGITNLQPSTSYKVQVVAYDQSQPEQSVSSVAKTFKTYGYCFLWWCW